MAENLVSGSSSSNKRMKKMGNDRLSELPDFLLVSILSLLSTREAIRTCVLSRRWQFLWTDLPALAFREGSLKNEKISEFATRVHKYLGICGGNHLRRFEVSFNYHECFASDVNAWVQFALKHKVENVALLFEDWRRERMYLLPQMMYSDSYLTCLRLRGCIMANTKSIQWGALSSLYLESVEFHENAIENILLCCPVLNDLTLDHCSHSLGLDSLHFKSKSLHKLTLIGWDYDDSDADGDLLLEISAPFVHYAQIFPYVEGRRFELMNISSLVEADIDFEAYQFDGMSQFDYTKRLFKKLHHVKKLKVGPEFIQALGDMVVEEGLRLSQSGVECLRLNASIENEDTIDGIVCLLKSSPNIKKLFISLWCNIYLDGLEKIELNHDFLHLKTVAITVHEEPELVAETMLILVQLLLERAPILEKLLINFSLPPSRFYPPLEYIKMAQTLVSYPRASTKAVVELAPVTFSG